MEQRYSPKPSHGRYGSFSNYRAFKANVPLRSILHSTSFSRRCGDTSKQKSPLQSGYASSSRKDISNRYRARRGRTAILSNLVASKGSAEPSLVSGRMLSSRMGSTSQKDGTARDTTTDYHVAMGRSEAARSMARRGYQEHGPGSEDFLPAWAVWKQEGR